MNISSRLSTRHLVGYPLFYIKNPFVQLCTKSATEIYKNVNNRV